MTMFCQAPQIEHVATCDFLLELLLSTTFEHLILFFQVKLFTTLWCSLTRRPTSRRSCSCSMWQTTTRSRPCIETSRSKLPRSSIPTENKSCLKMDPRCSGLRPLKSCRRDCRCASSHARSNDPAYATFLACPQKQSITSSSLNHLFAALFHSPFSCRSVG